MRRLKKGQGSERASSSIDHFFVHRLGVFVVPKFHAWRRKVGKNCKTNEFTW
jgi:hypothetical protein